MTSALLLLDGVSGVSPAATRKEPEYLRSLSREFLGSRRFLQVSLTPGLNSLSTKACSGWLLSRNPIEGGLSPQRLGELSSWAHAEVRSLCSASVFVGLRMPLLQSHRLSGLSPGAALPLLKSSRTRTFAGSCPISLGAILGRMEAEAGQAPSFPLCCSNCRA